MMFRYAWVLVLLLVLFGCQLQTQHDLPVHHSALHSSSLGLSYDEQLLWVVNPDADSISSVDLNTNSLREVVAVGQEPWALAVSPYGVVVVNRAGGSLSLVTEGHEQARLALGAEPIGLALSASGEQAFVSLSAPAQVVVVELASWQISERIGLSQAPWSIAVSDDGDSDERIIVTHHQAQLTESGEKQVSLSVIDPERQITTMTIRPYDFGFANILEGLVIHDDTIYTSHLLNSPEPPRAAFHTVSGAVTSFSLRSLREFDSRRIHLNDDRFSTPTNFPRAISISRDGSKLYVALAGTDAVMGIDLADPEQPRLLGFWPVGSNPRGLLLNRAGTRAYVMNYLSRDLSILDLSDTQRRPELQRIKLVEETLAAEILRGKLLFHKASDPRLSSLGWMSCGSCHIDGGVDGTSWGTPEGLRQTMPLWQLAGTAPFHISATRDEIQDFEFDIEHFMAGVGLAPGPAHTLLGKPNAATSADLDALARFVLEGIRVPRAAVVTDVDSLAYGREVFKRANCQSCHGGANWTQSQLPGEVGSLAPHGELEVEAVLRDVGTFKPEQDILGQKGFDVPTLLGVHATAPYLHDGSAPTLAEVLANPQHLTRSLSEAERVALIEFLLHIDAETPRITPR